MPQAFCRWARSQQASAIIVEAGPGKGNRLMAGSYIKPPAEPVSDPPPDPFDAGDDPFGL